MKYLKMILALSILYLATTSSPVSCDGLVNDIVKTVVVDPNGAADFKTIGDAIKSSVPHGNQNWIKIILNPGIYNEKVVIHKDMQKIILQGKKSASSEVIVQYDDSGKGNWCGPLVVYAEYFVAINIKFQNSYRKRTPKKEIAPAVVLHADKAWFSHCSFISVQDTVSDLVGRHYFENCYIEGSTDFIWGGGQSIYQNCTLYVKGVEGENAVGYITAQGRDHEKDTDGFVFKNCVIDGKLKSFLGRAYRNYSRVVFYETEMSNIVVPQGWFAWDFIGHEDRITYVEIRCTGEGANKQGRVKWEKELPDKEANLLLNLKTFIDIDHWMESVPFPLSSKI